MAKTWLIASVPSTSKLPKSVSQTSLKAAALDMLRFELSVDEICSCTDVDRDAFERYLRSNRHRLKSELEREESTKKPPEPEDENEAASPKIDPQKERQLHRPKAQQGEHAVLHAFIEKREIIVSPADAPLHLGITDSKGRDIPFERVLFIAVASVFIVSLLIFGLGDLIRNTPATAPEIEKVAPTIGANVSDSAQAVQVMKAFAVATDWKAKSDFVRRPDIVNPLMEKWYASHKREDLNWDDWEASAFLVDDMRFISIQFFQEDKGTSFEALFELRKNAYPLLDWESFVSYSPLTWDEFRDVRPVNPMTIRAHFEPADTYYPPFDDSEEYVPARLTHPNSTHVLIGYVKRNSPQGIILRNLVQNRQPGSRFPVIVDLQFPQGQHADPNLVEITSVLQTNWITRYPEAGK